MLEEHAAALIEQVDQALIDVRDLVERRERPELAQENAALNEVRVAFVESDLFDRIDGKFDLICCNPPLLSRRMIRKALSPCVYCLSRSIIQV